MVAAAEPGRGGESAIDANAVPYQQQAFAEFIATVGRFFYDDASIVLLDFLAREQRAFAELDLRERLRWRDNLLHQKLYALEKQLLLEKVIEAERGSKTVYLWRLHSQICLSIEWRLNAAVDKLKAEIREASSHTHFLCPKCNTRIEILDAVSGPKSLKDDHPLCRNCGVELTTSSSETARQAAEEKLKRAEPCFGRLRKALNRVRNMMIPAFTSTPWNETQPRLATTPSPAGDVSPNAEVESTKSSDHQQTAAQATAPQQQAAPTEPATNTRHIPWFDSSMVMTGLNQGTSGTAPSSTGPTGSMTSAMPGSLLQSKTSASFGTFVRRPTPATPANRLTLSVGGAGGPLVPGRLGGRSSDVSGTATSLSGPKIGLPTPPSSVIQPKAAPISLSLTKPVVAGSVSGAGTSDVSAGTKPFSLSLARPQADTSDNGKRRAPTLLASAFGKKVKF